jgi:hypothetical protein
MSSTTSKWSGPPFAIIEFSASQSINPSVSYNK